MAFFTLVPLKINVKLLLLLLFLTSTWSSPEALAFYPTEGKDNFQKDSVPPQHYRKQLNYFSGLSVSGKNHFDSFGSFVPVLPFIHFFLKDKINPRDFIPDTRQELTTLIFPFHLFW